MSSLWTPSGEQQPPDRPPDRPPRVRRPRPTASPTRAEEVEALREVHARLVATPVEDVDRQPRARDLAARARAPRRDHPARRRRHAARAEPRGGRARDRRDGRAGRRAGRAPRRARAGAARRARPRPRCCSSRSPTRRPRATVKLVRHRAGRADRRASSGSSRSTLEHVPGLGRRRGRGPIHLRLDAGPRRRGRASGGTSRHAEHERAAGTGSRSRP